MAATYDVIESTITRRECVLRVRPDTSVDDLMGLRNAAERQTGYHYSTARVSIEDGHIVVSWETLHECPEPPIELPPSITPDLMDALRQAYNAFPDGHSVIPGNGPTANLFARVADIIAVLEDWDGNAEEVAF